MRVVGVILEQGKGASNVCYAKIQIPIVVEVSPGRASTQVGALEIPFNFRGEIRELALTVVA